MNTTYYRWKIKYYLWKIKHTLNGEYDLGRIGIAGAATAAVIAAILFKK